MIPVLHPSCALSKSKRAQKQEAKVSSLKFLNTVSLRTGTNLKMLVKTLQFHETYTSSFIKPLNRKHELYFSLSFRDQYFSQSHAF